MNTKIHAIVDGPGKFVAFLLSPGNDNDSIHAIELMNMTDIAASNLLGDKWWGMYLYDIFGRPLWEDVEVPEQKDSTGRVISLTHTECRQKLNPDYDNTQKYTPRSERPEWNAVGMLGKLVAVDDGTCVWSTDGVPWAQTVSQPPVKAA